MKNLFTCCICAAIALLGLGGIGIGIGFAGGQTVMAIARNPSLSATLIGFFAHFILIPEIILVLILVIFAWVVIKKCFNRHKCGCNDD